MRFFISALCTLLFASRALTAPGKVSYYGHKVLRIALGASEAEAEKVHALITNLSLDTWTHSIAPHRNVDVQVSPEKLSAFISGLGGIPYSTMHADLGVAIREESEAMAISEGEYMAPWNSTWLKRHSWHADLRYVMVQLVSLV
jgi:hypothetical protein